MNEDILHAQLVEERRREKDRLISNARQLALEKWMEAVTNLLLCRNDEIRKIRECELCDALEEYKRVSKP